MAAQQELIAAVRSMQANAQANLPVIPNNGNPNGAYNAPRQGLREPPKRSTYDLSWLEPSPAMRQMQDNLSQRQGYLDSMLAQIRQQPAPPLATPAQQPAQQPVMPMNRVMSPQLPTLPMSNASGGVVLPSTGMNTGIIPNAMQQPSITLPQFRTV